VTLVALSAVERGKAESVAALYRITWLPLSSFAPMTPKVGARARRETVAGLGSEPRGRRSARGICPVGG
jgi:hypothetical protein